MASKALIACFARMCDRYSDIESEKADALRELQAHVATLREMQASSSAITDESLVRIVTDVGITMGKVKKAKEDSAGIIRIMQALHETSSIM